MATTAVIACILLAGVVVCLLLVVAWFLRAWVRMPVEARALALVMAACGWVTAERAGAILGLAWGKYVQPSIDRQANPQAGFGSSVN